MNKRGMIGAVLAMLLLIGGCGEAKVSTTETTESVTTEATAVAETAIAETTIAETTIAKTTTAPDTTEVATTAPADEGPFSSVLFFDENENQLIPPKRSESYYAIKTEDGRSLMVKLPKVIMKAGEFSSTEWTITADAALPGGSAPVFESNGVTFYDVGGYKEFGYLHYSNGVTLDKFNEYVGYLPLDVNPDFHLCILLKMNNSKSTPQELAEKYAEYINKIQTEAVDMGAAPKVLTITAGDYMMTIEDPEVITNHENDFLYIMAKEVSDGKLQQTRISKRGACDLKGPGQKIYNKNNELVGAFDIDLTCSYEVYARVNEYFGYMFYQFDGSIDTDSLQAPDYGWADVFHVDASDYTFEEE